MKTAQQLAASLRKMAAEFPATDEEQGALKDAAGMLELIQEHVEDMEQKGKACRGLAEGAPFVQHKAVLAAKASAYDEEARRLRAIMESNTTAPLDDDWRGFPSKATI